MRTTRGQSRSSRILRGSASKSSRSTHEVIASATARTTEPSLVERARSPRRWTGPSVHSRDRLRHALTPTAYGVRPAEAAARARAARAAPPGCAGGQASMQGTDQPTRSGAEATLELPSGTVTFLFTDIEGSTRLLAQLGNDAYTGGPPRPSADRPIRDRALARGRGRHPGRRVLRGVREHVRCGRLRTRRAASHGRRTCGPTARRSGSGWRSIPARPGSKARGYVGIEVHRAARIVAAAHGGQVLLSEAASTLAQDQLPDGVTLVELGEHRLKDLDRTERLFQLAHPELIREFPPLRTLDYRPNNLPVAGLGVRRPGGGAGGHRGPARDERGPAGHADRPGRQRQDPAGASRGRRSGRAAPRPGSSSSTSPR